jgi:hypothetical protein
MDVLKYWKFDPVTAILTVVFAPLAMFLLKVVVKHLKELSSYIIEGGMYWISRFVKHSLAGALTLRRYCRLQLAGQNRYLYIPSSDDLKLEIDDVFVALMLESSGVEKQTYNHRDILTVGNRIRVIGDPGSGKSSLVKKLFRDCCQSCIKRPRKSRLPILFELKNIELPKKSGKLDDCLYQLLRSDAMKTSVYRMNECFDSYAQTVGLLVLLDGLDEVSSSDYPKVREAINGLSRRLEQLSDQNIIVVTMRTQFHQQVKEDYRDSFGHAMALKAFSPSDIYEFLTKWRFKAESHENIARIYKDLTDRPTLREMCSNPLVLSMYVAEDQASGHVETPDSRTQFYGKVTEELLTRRRARQTGPALAATKLREQRERILGRLAYDHLLDPNQPTNYLAFADGVRVIQEVLKCKADDAEKQFDELAKETGLITEERKRQSFRFIHLTFCEFLAAYEAVQGQQNGWSTLIEAHRRVQDQPLLHARSRLLEVIPFAAGLLPRIKREEALGSLSEMGDMRLLARCFLETKLYDHPSWGRFVTIQMQSLLSTPEEAWDTQWLADLYLFNVVVRDGNDCASHIPVPMGKIDLGEFFRELLTKQKTSLGKLLGAYASQDAAAVLRVAEVCNLDLTTDFSEIVIANCDQAPFFALLRDQASREPERVRSWAKLFAEAGLRSRLVAVMMSRSGHIESWSNVVVGIPRNKRWFSPPHIPLTFYTQCISVAMATGVGDASSFPMSTRLCNIPSPGAFYFTWMASRLLAIPMLVAFAVPVFVLLGAAAAVTLGFNAIPSIREIEMLVRDSAYRGGTVIVLLTGLMLIAEVVLFRSIGLLRTYRAILGVTTRVSHEIQKKRFTLYFVALLFPPRGVLIPSKFLIPSKLVAAVAEFEEMRVAGISRAAGTGTIISG